MKRPGYAKKYERTFPLLTNFLPIKLTLKFVYHYDVEIELADISQHMEKCSLDDKVSVGAGSGKVKNRKFDRDTSFRIIRKLIEDNRTSGKVFYDSKSMKSIEPVYDGNKNMYTASPLPGLEPKRPGQKKHFDVVIPEGSVEVVKNYKSKITGGHFRVTIKVTGESDEGKCAVDMQHLNNYRTDANISELCQVIRSTSR